MENISPLAIASVPVQSWNQIYDEDDAFKNGTIFPELNMPFYVTVEDEELNKVVDLEKGLTNEEAMLLKIQKVGFVLDDLRLYMDTHPDDKEGLKLLKSSLRRKKSLMKEFALQFYPLTPECMEDIYVENPDSECYCWNKGKIPWEGVSK